MMGPVHWVHHPGRNRGRRASLTLVSGRELRTAVKHADNDGVVVRTIDDLDVLFDLKVQIEIGG